MPAPEGEEPIKHAEHGSATFVSEGSMGAEVPGVEAEGVPETVAHTGEGRGGIEEQEMEEGEEVRRGGDGPAAEDGGGWGARRGGGSVDPFELFRAKGISFQACTVCVTLFDSSK